MKNIYACLLGNWVNLNDDPDCVMGENKVSPYIWYEENAIIFNRSIFENDTFYQLPHINIKYCGKDYRINPIFIQIVTE